MTAWKKWQKIVINSKSEDVQYDIFIIAAVVSVIMNEFNPNRNLCMVAAIVTPMTAEQQEWMRLGGNDAGKVFEDATDIDLTDPEHKGASTRDARKFFQFVCEENRTRGINLKYELKRVNGRVGELKNWDVASITQTIVNRNGHYVLIGLSKRLDDDHPKILKRIRAVDGEVWWYRI